MLKLIITMVCLCSLTFLSAINLTYDKVLRNLRGIKSYDSKSYDEARQSFEENVINHPGEGALHFNLGNTYYREGNLDAALNEYLRALRDDEFPQKSNIYHNIGNALFEKQNYKDALMSYRNAIIENPDNFDARYNYELTRLLLQAMQDQQQQQPQSGEGDDEDNQQQQQQQADAQPDDSEDGEEAEVVERREGEGDQPQESDPDRERKLEEAENILRTLMARERELLEKERERQRDDIKLRGRFW